MFIRLLEFKRITVGVQHRRDDQFFRVQHALLEIIFERRQSNPVFALEIFFFEIESQSNPVVFGIVIPAPFGLERSLVDIDFLRGQKTGKNEEN